MNSVPSVFALGLLASCLASRPALAATPTTSFSVTATVQASCRASANAMAFRTYAAEAANTTFAVSVICTNSAPYNVSLSAGMGSGATVAIREMTGSGTALLGYAPSSNPRGIVNRGRTVGTDTVAGTGNRSAQALADHYLIAAGQYVEAGAYADTISVTVTY